MNEPWQVAVIFLANCVATAGVVVLSVWLGSKLRWRR